LEKKVDFEHKLIDLSNKPPEFLQKYAKAVGGDTSIRAKVPLLEYGDELVVESDVVTKFVAHIGDDDCMYPVHDEELRECVDRFIKSFEAVKEGYYKYLSATSEEEVETGKQAFCESLAKLDAELKGPFCLGETFSVAECIAAPWVHRFMVTIPYFRGVSMQALDPPEKVAKWMDAVLERPSVKSTNGPEDYLLKSTKNFFVKCISPGAPAAKDQ